MFPQHHRFRPVPGRVLAWSGRVAHPMILLTVFLCYVPPVRAQFVCSIVIELASSAQTAAIGVPITFTASVKNAYSLLPFTAGTVTFLDAFSPIPGSATAVDSSGVAVFNVALGPGLHSITAAHSSGAVCSVPSIQSRVYVFVVAEPQPVMTIASSANPAVYGTPLAFTITLASPVTGGPVPTGGVTLFDGPNGPDFDGSFSTTAYQLFPYVLNAASQVMVQLPLVVHSRGPVAGCGGCNPARGIVLAAGLHSVIAYYSGDANYAPAQVSLSQQVTKASTAITLTSSPYGQTEAITAVVSISPQQAWAGSVFGLLSSYGPTLGFGDPTGTVQFFDGANLIGAAPVGFNAVTPAVASILTTTPLTGSITAVYSGDSNYIGSTFPPLPPPQAPSSSVTITVSPAAPTIGQLVTLTATIITNNGTLPATGTMQFTDGANLLGIVAVTGGLARLSTTLSSGSHTITATYGGDATYPVASSTYGLQATRLASSLSLTSNTTSAVFGQPITFTASLANTQASGGLAAPSGRVQFFAGCLCGLFGMMVDRTLIGTADLANGLATLTVTTLAPGSTQVLATYSGDDNWSSSNSNALTQTIAKAVSPSLISITDLAGHNLSNVAPDEIVSIVGVSLATTTVQITDMFGRLRIAPLLVSPAQLNIVIPGETALGPATVTLIDSRGVTFSPTISVARTAPVLFAADNRDEGPAAAQIIRQRPDGSQSMESVAVFDAARSEWLSVPIDVASDPLYLVLYGTGIRHRLDNGDVTCKIDGQNLPVLYSGAQPSFVGLDQLVVQLPLSLRGPARYILQYRLKAGHLTPLPQPSSSVVSPIRQQ